MYQIKHFKSRSIAEQWIENNKDKYQIERIFCNNVPYSIEYKPLITIL